MKTFIVRVKNNEKSENYAQDCLKSCKGKFDAELFDGVNPSTLEYWSNIYKLEPMAQSRAIGHQLASKKIYDAKKSCFLNHVRLWNKCVELNEPIAFIEHDAHCINAWDNKPFDELLILNIKSALNQEVFKLLKNQVDKINFGLGICEYKQSPLVFKKNPKFHGGLMMPGTAAYAITPKGAKRLLSHLHMGWEQSDYYINTKSVRIQYANPEYFTFKLPNLQMSHGI